jgi:hypothetical protein
MKRAFRNDYPADWHEIATAVKQAAGWRCVRCRHPYRPGDDPRQCDEQCTHPPDRKCRMLTVDHLDGDKANGRWWNLAPLCQFCHLQVQGKVIMQRPWVWDHTTWFRPYAAGYYAWRYLGLDLTREEVEARLDELLSLERDAVLGVPA